VYKFEKKLRKGCDMFEKLRKGCDTFDMINLCSWQDCLKFKQESSGFGRGGEQKDTNKACLLTAVGICGNFLLVLGKAIVGLYKTY
jgi:hypothetical protein